MARNGVSTGPGGCVGCGPDRGGRTARQPGMCDLSELQAVVSSLSDQELEGWIIGAVDTRLPDGCAVQDGVNAAIAERKVREHDRTARQAAAARDRAGGGTEVRQTVIPDTVNLPLVGEVDTVTAGVALGGTFILLRGSGGFGGGGDRARSSAPDPADFSGWQEFSTAARKAGLSFEEAGKLWRERSGR